MYFLQSFNPALFQNIILGVLAIFIPLSIVFFTDILKPENNRSEFEKMVLSDEVLGAKKIFWVSVGGMVFFAFFSGVDTSPLAKIVSIIVVVILIVFFWKSFKNMLRFSEGNKRVFEIKFFKNLNFSKIFKSSNQEKADKMLRAWKSFWSERLECDEPEITRIFISHIDDVIKFGEFEIAIQLAQTYVDNIEKRNNHLVDYYILPKIFEWNEFLWNEKQLFLKNCNTEKKNQSSIVREPFWRWDYFSKDFFQAIITTISVSGGNFALFFDSFKKYIDKSKNKLEKITDKKEKESYRSCITELFSSFCPIFFNAINSSPSYSNNYFPFEWKISTANENNIIVPVILEEFLKWSEPRIFKIERQDKCDDDLTKMIGILFPNVYSSLFTVFLMLFFSNEVKDVLEKEPNFYITSYPIVPFSCLPEESDKEINIAKTIQIILKFFHFWPILDYYNGLSKDEVKNWGSYSTEAKELIKKRVRKQKFEVIKGELESEAIEGICKDSKLKTRYRNNLLQLVELLILEIEK